MPEVFGAVFYIIVLIYSVMAHEVAHGVVADKLGDPTARLANRLNFNPLNHIDPMGSVILPLFLYLVSNGEFVFGWAKPVPYNPYNLRNPEKSAGLIGAAGPMTNIAIAIVFGLILRFFDPFLSSMAEYLIVTIVYLNIVLAVFNFVPLPPLDGSKVLFAFLPPKYNGVKVFLESQGMIILIFFVFFGYQIISPVIGLLFHIIVG